MDVSAHILDAVQTASDPQGRRTSFRPSAPHPPSSALRSHRSRPRFMKNLSAHSSVEELSTGSDSEGEHGYTTDLTSPSEHSPDEMTSEDVEEFRGREYPQLKGKTYLDHGGTTLYARSLIEEFSADLIANLYGNPHSASTPSAIAGHRVDAIRHRALRFFGADPADYDLVFVANATAAIKLVIDCFKDYAASTNTPVWYGYHKDAHTSLVGVRETTSMHRCFTSDEEVETWIKSGGFGGPRARQLGLFAYPGQSNMTGRRLPVSWPGRIRKQFHRAATYTLLDAAALASTAPLDLSDPATAPDFVAMSFYKIFGFPNVGALIVRKDAAHVLQKRKYFGGGTVEMIITINDDWHAKKDTSIHERLEDGTLPFHSIFALDHAINVHERLYGPNPMKFISRHTAALGKQLYDGIHGMRHSNGAPLAKIYKDDAAVYGDASSQGATIAFNVMRSDGSLIGYEEVEEAADQRNIYVRSGSLCNPGGVATYLEWSPAEMRAAYAAGHRCSNPTQIMLGRPTGVVRVSLGAMSTATDVRTFLRFLEDVYLDNKTGNAQKPRALHIPTTQYSHRQQNGMSHLPLTPVSASPTTTSPPTLPHIFSNTTTNDNTSSQRSPLSSTLPPLLPLSLDDPPPPPTEPVERPRFNPADYIKHRRPWEEELRKGHWANATPGPNADWKLPGSISTTITSSGGAGGPSDDTSSTTKTGAPSLKARKFGRSMVNLLRAKDKSSGVAIPAAAAAAAGGDPSFNQGIKSPSSNLSSRPSHPDLAALAAATAASTAAAAVPPPPLAAAVGGDSRSEKVLHAFAS